MTTALRGHAVSDNTPYLPTVHTVVHSASLSNCNHGRVARPVMPQGSLRGRETNHRGTEDAQRRERDLGASSVPLCLCVSVVGLERVHPALHSNF